MLTWMGFIGKLIEVIVTKVAGNKIDLLLNEKRRAAKAFIRFHEAVTKLEDNVGEILTDIEKFVKSENKKFFVAHINYKIQPLSDASTEFVKSLEELGSVLHFYDDTLSALFSRVIAGKTEVFYNISTMFAKPAGLGIPIPPINSKKLDSSETQYLPEVKFEIEEVGYFHTISYTIPNEKLLSTDFVENFDNIGTSSGFINKFYRLITRDTENRESDFNNIRQFQLAVLAFIKKNIDVDSAHYDDKEKFIELYTKLVEHKEILEKARESLRDFIKERFSLEDILSVVKK